MGGEHVSSETFAEILYHVVTLWFTMYVDIKTKFFLDLDYVLNFFLDEFFILFLGDLTFGEFITL